MVDDSEESRLDDDLVIDEFIIEFYSVLKQGGTKRLASGLSSIEGRETGRSKGDRGMITSEESMFGVYDKRSDVALPKKGRFISFVRAHSFRQVHGRPCLSHLHQGLSHSRERSSNVYIAA